MKAISVNREVRHNFWTSRPNEYSEAADICLCGLHHRDKIHFTEKDNEPLAVLRAKIKVNGKPI